MPAHLRRALTRMLVSAALLECGAPACSPVTSAEGAPTDAVLFIGNSLTYTNDLPSVLGRLGEAAHDPLRVAMVAEPNLALIDHVNGATDAAAQIDRARWTFVVLQQGPTSSAGVCRDTLILAAMRLAPHIRRAGGRPAIFLPWVRRGQSERLEEASESARLAARAVGGVVAPIGIAWRDALSDDPATPLYGPDGYHPAPAGTLLAALTLYDRLFGRDVRSLPIEPVAGALNIRLTPAQLHALAAAAHQASASLPPDPPTPVPADTTVVSSGGGPC